MGRGNYSRVGLDGCGQCAKYLLFVFNLLVLIGGLAIAIIGIIAVATDDYYRFTNFTDNNLFHSAAFIQIVVGFLVVLFAFLGCCGAIKESKPLLYTYGVVTLIVFVLLLVAGILAIVYKSDAKKLIGDELKKQMGKYDKADPTTMKAWDNLQKEGKCCGIDGQSDWIAFGQGFSTNDRYPKSCCASGDASCLTADPNNAYKDGCIKILDKILSFSSALSWVAIAIGVVLLLSVIFAFCVGCAL